MGHVVGDSPFLKRVLLPFWIIRIIVMLIDAALYALLLAVLGAYHDELDDEARREYGTDLNVGAIIGIIAVVLVLLIACLAIDIACIIKRARRTLSPRLFLILNVVQTTIWTVLFVLSMVGARSGASVAIDVIVYLSFLGVLIYASVIFHRARKGTLVGTYAPANNPEAYKLDQQHQSGFAPADPHNFHHQQPPQPSPYGQPAYPEPYHGAQPSSVYPGPYNEAPGQQSSGGYKAPNYAY